MRLALLTAAYDNYDELKELPPQDVAYEAICVTDDPNLHSESWTVVYDPQPGVHPNRAAKKPKFCPWNYTDATFSIWIDASFRVMSPAFIGDALDIVGTQNESPLAQFPHNMRDCLYDEAEISIGMAKYATEPLAEQVARYREWGHPTHWGLWATGIMFRYHTPEVVELGERWMKEVADWSFQDQVSQPAMLREVGIRPLALPGFYWAGQNPWFGYEGSSRH